MQRHPLDPISLIAGGLFSGIALLLLTGHLTAGSRHLNLIWAVAAVLAGLGLIAPLLRRAISGADAGPLHEATGPLPPPADDAETEI
jgi:hypothetical protein